MTKEQDSIFELKGATIFKRILNRQLRAFLSYARKNGIENAINQIDTVVKVEQLKAEYVAFYARVGMFVIPNTINEIKTLVNKRETPASIGVGFISETWRKFVSNYANSLLITQRITKVNETTKSNIRTVMSNALKDGEGSASIALRISKEKLSVINEARAVLIARTELTHITSVASHFGAEQSESITGVSLEKGWSTRIDGRERPEHQSANNQFVKMNESFTVGGVKMKYPGDPNGGAENVCNCRCTQIFRPSKRVELPNTDNTSVNNAFSDLLAGIAVAIVRGGGDN